MPALNDTQAKGVKQVWPYDKNLPFSFGHVTGWFHVAYKRLAPMRGTRDPKLNGIEGWMRLVTWTGVNPPESISHVNIDSDLSCLVRAGLHWIRDAAGTKYGFFLIDYATDRIVLVPTSDLDEDETWRYPIALPSEL